MVSNLSQIPFIANCTGERRESKEMEISFDEPLDLSKNHQEPQTFASQKSIGSDLFQHHHPFSIRNFLQPIKITDSTLSRQLNELDFSASGFPRNASSFQPSQISSRASVTTVFRPILRTRGKERSLLPCSVCGKAFDRPSLLKRHMRTHTGEKPHICVCGKGFSTSSSLNTHRRIHTGEKPHQCPFPNCGKRFTASSNLYYHRMTHNKEKPHKCLCGKSFPTPGDLKSHQYVHSGTWPYNCPVCQRGFSKQTNLRNHVLLHSGDRPHHCDKCGKKFALACNLRAHLKTHEEDQPQSLSSSLQSSKCLKCKRILMSKGEGFCESCKNGKREITQISPPTSANEPHINFQSASSFGSSRPKFDQGNLGMGDGGLYNSSSSSDIASMTNPFLLEHLFAWNLQFVQETGLLQQKIIESQIIASAQNFSNSFLPFSLPVPIAEQTTSNFDWSNEDTNKTQRE